METVVMTMISYLIGSLPTGYLVTRKILGTDIRDHGSGNVGATNVARKLGFRMGALVALVDIIKGLIPVMLARTFLPAGQPAYLLYIIGIAAILGHDNSIFLKFDGGKGVATTFGVMLGISPPAFVVLGAVWLFIAFTLKIVSVASLLGTLTLPVSAYLLTGSMIEVLLAGIVFLSIVITHRGNIERLMKGEEKPISMGEN